MCGRVAYGAFVAGLLIFAACGNGDLAGTTTTTRPAATTTITTTTTTTTTETRPALGAVCDTERYRIRYPDDWSVNAGNGVRACRFFHPESFTLPEATEVLDLAISIDVASRDFGRIVSDTMAGPSGDVVSSEELTIAGRDARRIEVRASGRALLPSGTLTTSYFVDLGDVTFVASTSDIADLDYAENTEVLARMVATLEVEDEQVGDCSAAGVASDLEPQDLPAEVATTSQQIVSAAVACDFDRLADIAAASPMFTYSFGGSDNPAVFWRAEEEAGREPLRILVEVLRMSHGSRPGGDTTQYLWPEAYIFERWDDVPEENRQELRAVYSHELIDTFAAAGTYLGHRVGIDAEGHWLFFVAGD